MLHDDNYVVIQGWMINKLNLKGNDLLVYAIIYSFSQDGSTFKGSLQYIADWCNSSKQGILKNIKNLIDLGFIDKKETVINGVNKVEYRSTKLNDPLNKVERTVQHSLTNNIVYSENNKEVLSKDNTMSETEVSNSFLGSAKHIIEINKDKEVDKFLELYKEHCTNFPKIKKLTPARRDGILALLKEYTWDDIIEAFDKANESDFLQGKCDGTWKADFDFFLKKDKFIKILEGKYGGRKKGKFELEGKTIKATKEEEQEQERWREEMNRHGQQTRF